MKLSKLDRRDFIESMLLVGLTACAGPGVARRALRAAPPAEAAMGPLFTEVARLSDDLAGGRISGHGFARRFGGRPGVVEAILFYTPAGVTNPPHEHHNLISIKRVLKGSYHVRQYERVR